MSISKRILQQLCLAGIFLIFLTGCATVQKTDMDNTSANYNLIVEKAQNEMLFLNIIRASKRKPMYFTGFNQLRGSMTYTVNTGSINIPFGPGSTTVYTITGPNAIYSANPSFDVIVWDNKEFITGIMTHVSADTAYDYINQGWHKAMLFPLLIGKIEIIKNGSTPFVLKNDPCIDDEFTNFNNKLEELLSCELVCKKNSNKIGPAIDAKDVTLEELIKVKEAGLDFSMVEGNTKKYQLTKSQNDYSFKCPTKVYEKLLTVKDNKQPNLTKKLDGEYSIKLFFSNESTPSNKDEKPANESTPSKKDEKPAIVISLRTPEGILYFLGELLRRKERQPDYHYEIKYEESEGKYNSYRLFEAQKATDNDKDASVAVDYEGAKYIIPKYDIQGPDRSMHVLSFVSLLISQYKAGMNIPPTSTVNISGSK